MDKHEATIIFSFVHLAGFSFFSFFSFNVFFLVRCKVSSPSAPGTRVCRHDGHDGHGIVLVCISTFLLVGLKNNQLLKFVLFSFFE